MADIQIYDVTDGLYDSALTSTIAGAATGTIPYDANKMRHAAFRISNGGGQTATVTFSAGATGGVRSSLGTYTRVVENGYTEYLPLWDTARFLNLADSDIDYAMSTTGTTASVLMEVVTI